jgi:hypothetical protein
VLLGINVANIAIYLLTKAYYIWRNKQKEKKWSALSKDVSEYPFESGNADANAQKEQLRYMETTKDSGSKRLDFRFAH